MHVLFRGREKAIERQERAALRRALVQAFHTERFARIKKLSGQDLKSLLDQIESGTKRKPMTQAQLWDTIKATHALLSAKKKTAKRGRR